MIIVFGSLSGDHVAGVDALPKPGETRLATSYQLLPGGKGANQAVAAAKAGAQVMMCGSVGNDTEGALSRRALQAAGVRCDGLRTVDAPTGLAFVWVDRSAENSIVVAPNANTHTRAADTQAFVQQASHVLVQMEVPAAETWRFLAMARTAGCTTVCNLAPELPIPHDAWPRLDVLIVNAHEAASLVQGPPTPEALANVAVQRNTTLVMTQGAQGAMAFTGTGEVWHVPALPITPVDTTGAGDAFVGALVARLDLGQSLPEALHYASVASGLACLATGAQSGLAIDAAVQQALHRVPSATLVQLRR